MYQNPVELIEAKSWENQCKKLIKKLHLKNPIIITSQGHIKRQKLFNVFRDYSILDEIKPNPTFESCQEAVSFVQKLNPDGVIALGGGSVMDTAKVVLASLSTNIVKIERLINFKKSYNKKVPSIFIPTTHGTGSEVTMWGTIWNMNERKKYSISHNDLYPTYAILDAKLTLSLPLEMSIITLMDALSHSFEAIWNKNSNPTSNKLAIESICQILENVEKLKENPSSLQTRKNLLEASAIAGLAFSNTATAAAHAISYPLTMDFKIPHGIASSLSLLPLIKLNKNFIINELNLIIKKMKIRNLEELEDRIKNITANFLPFRLDYWGVNKEDLNNIAEQSFQNDRIQNNIQSLSSKNIQDILLEVYHSK